MDLAKNVDETELQKAINNIATATAAVDDNTTGMTSGASVSPLTGSEQSDVLPKPPELSVPGMGIMPPVGETTPEAVAPAPLSSAPAIEPMGAVEDIKMTSTPEETTVVESFDSMDPGVVRDKVFAELGPIAGTVDLKPLVAKMDLTPESKFRVYKEIIEATRDRAALGVAYAAAKDITDDQSRAEALLYIVEMADKLGTL